ncbi:MFS monocarboxylate transporter protein [Rutstroemia sp. NJR-2017a BBW]|nr:MFS monocarboxylate transporter protein [Rutstroemia sp. NJR-2017a BBW]
MAATQDVEKNDIHQTHDQSSTDQRMSESTKVERPGDASDVTSQIEAPIAPPQAPGIPDGGFVAWLQVLGSAPSTSLYIYIDECCRGIVNTYGVFQTYYESDLLRTESPSNISWIGSIQAFLLLLVGVITGPLFDAGRLRLLLCTGTLLVVLGLMMTSISKTYWEVLLAQAICMGIGLGCLFVPSVAIVSTYFSTRKAFAMGIAASGSSLVTAGHTSRKANKPPGGVIYPIIFHNLQPSIGFGWATRVLGFISLATLSISLTTMRMRVQPAHKRSLIDQTAFRSPSFWLFTIGLFFGFMGLYVPFFYVQSYALDEHIMNANSAFYMLSVINAASIFGRIIPNWLADRMGPLNVLIPGTAIARAGGFLSPVWVFLWLVRVYPTDCYCYALAEFVRRGHEDGNDVCDKWDWAADWDARGGSDRAKVWVYSCDCLLRCVCACVGDFVCGDETT